MYGASFHTLHRQREYNELCNVTVIGASSNMSSVSSDPTHVCLCDSQGMPQCDQLVLPMQVSAGEYSQFELSLLVKTMVQPQAQSLSIQHGPRTSYS